MEIRVGWLRPYSQQSSKGTQGIFYQLGITAGRLRTAVMVYRPTMQIELLGTRGRAEEAPADSNQAA